MFSPQERLIVVGADCIHRGGKTSVHEFGHAFDHTWHEKIAQPFAPSKLLWHRHEATRTAFLSDYAATNPAEYFAVSFEAYFNQRDRQRLQDIDPDMYRYLETVDQVSHRGQMAFNAA